MISDKRVRVRKKHSNDVTYSSKKTDKYMMNKI
jgi:hypothetical protein